MNFSTDYSCFNTPHYYRYIHQTRPNPHRKRGRKRRLDDVDNDGDGDDDEDGAGNRGSQGLDNGYQAVSEASPFAARADGIAVTHAPPDEGESNGTTNTKDSNDNNGASYTHECDTDAEVHPTRPTNPRQLTKDCRFQLNTKTLESHGLFLPPQKHESLRARHHAILSAILHKSVMTRDWARAKRAFAMLIRTENIDIRKIWPLGCDILLMCPPPEQASRCNDNGVSPSTALPLHVETKTTQSHIQNIKYLRRLILQFPFIGISASQSLSQSTNASFSTFAAERVQHASSGPVPILLRGQARMQYANAATFWPFLIAAMLAESDSTNSPSGLSPPRHDGGGDGITENVHEGYNYNYQNTVQGDVDEKRDPISSAQAQAQTQMHLIEIKAQLDELIHAPPWIDDPRLWCIRGMICLWLADLQEPLLAGEAAPDDEHKCDPNCIPDMDTDNDDDGLITPDSLVSDNEDDEAAERRRHKRGMRAGHSRHALLHEAKVSLGMVAKKGGRVPSLLGRAVRKLRKMDHDK